MDITPKTKKPMTKDEVALLVDLIISKPILTSKETNAATNKMKESAWSSLEAEYNSKIGQIPRSKEQLKLKWDNLKKAARKRAQQIRMNLIKTGGGKPNFIPPDEILEKVSGLLGSTCTGFEVLFGGDGPTEYSVDVESVDGAGINIDNHTDPYSTDITNTNEAKKQRTDEETIVETPQKRLFGLPKLPNVLQTRKGKKQLDKGQRERNQAIAKYYEKKTEKLELEIQLLKSQLLEKTNDSKSSPLPQ